MAQEGCEVSDQTIRRWADGIREPRLGEAFTLSKVLGVPLEYLADDSSTSPSSGSDLTREQAEILLVAEKIGYRLAWQRLTLTEEPVSAEPILVPERPARRA
jgi:transcriptional regulator with XRE-family HTH domain